MKKHNWNHEVLRKAFNAMLEYAEMQEIENETDNILGSYWSGMKDALLVATSIINEEES